jgi:AraC-like DNA-binding protein
VFRVRDSGAESTSCRRRIDQVAGRPVADRLTADQVAEARCRHPNGESIRALAREFGCAHSTLAARMRASERAESAAAAGAATGSGALAGAAVAHVERLEAAYRQAFAAIETLVGAIEAVMELRGQEQIWKEASELGLAPMRPEPWQVRVSHDEQLRSLHKRFTAAVNSRW